MIETIRDNLLELFCASAAAAVSALIAKLYGRFRGLAAAVLAINHDRRYQVCSAYLLAGQITVEELKNLEYLYEGYHALGGNGTGTELYAKCRELPLAEKRTERCAGSARCEEGRRKS